VIGVYDAYDSTMNRRIVLFVADTHAGHKSALCNPDTRWREEGVDGKVAWIGPTLNGVQRWLWDNYTQAIKEAIGFAHGDDVLLIHNGDITWGTKYPNGLMSSRLDIQTTMGYYNLLPFLEHENVSKVRLIHGTESHEFYEGTANNIIADHLSLGFPGRDISTARHMLGTVNGVLFDIAHHGPSGGIRVWTAGNQFRYNLKSIMLEDLISGRTPPRVVARAHYHTYNHETVRVMADREVTSDIFMCPGNCGLTHYAVQATRSAYAIHAGVVAVEIVDGRYREMRPYYERVDIRIKETL